jgi:hypothetical protein
MSNSTCSLREAVTSANTNLNTHEPDCEIGQPTQDTINVPAGTYTLSGASGENANASGDLDITGGGPVVVTGPGIDASDQPLVIVDGANNDRLFDLILNPGQQVDVELLAMQLRNGNAGPAGDGGAVEVGDPDARLIIDSVIFTSNDVGGYGGAVHYPDGVAASRFRVEQSEFAGNFADEEGGALWLDILEDPVRPEIVNSAFVGNMSNEGGAAIYLGTRALNGIFLEVTNTTISGNMDFGGGGGAVGFDLSETGNVSFQFSTIANNSTTLAGGGGAIRTMTALPEEQFVLINNTIIAGNTAAGAPSNCDGPGNVQGSFSVESLNSCGLSLANSLVNTDPQLAPLAFNAGEMTTRTHGLYDSSPAVNHSPVGQCSGMFPITTFDQRYVPRPAGAACDTGAFEGTVGPAPAGPANPATPATPAKKCKKKKKKKKRSAVAAKKKKKGCKKKKKKKK